MLTPMEDVGTCDACRAPDVERQRYRLIRSSGAPTSRSVALCSACRAPVEVLLRAVPPKTQPTPIVVEDITDLVPTKTILAQQVAKPKAKPRRRKVST